MKFLKSLTFMLVAILFISSSVIEAKKARFRNRRLERKNKAQTKGFNIGAIFNLVKKYEEFSKTNFGAFMNGFFLGLMDSITSQKAAVQCTQNKFWEVVQCFVGGGDVALDKYYADLPQYKSLPDSAEKDIEDAEKEAEKVANDPDVKKGLDTQPKDDNSVTGWLKAGWTYVKKSYESVVETIKNKITGWWEKAQKFFDSPLIKGLTKVAKCVAPIAFEEMKDPALNAALTFLGVPWASKIKNILLNAPFILTKLKELFQRLRTTLTAVYQTPQQKYYNYGKATEDVIFTLHTILSKARRLRRFRRLLMEN